MKKRSKLQAIFAERCPRCRQGNIFVHPWYKVTHFEATREECPCCRLRYEVEPGFFIASMYFSYAFAVGIMVVAGVSIYYLFGNPPLWVYLVGVIGLQILAIPFSFRYARVLLLHFFSGVDYQPSWSC